MKINCADAITLITGHLTVSVDRLYSLYNELTGDNLYTHQLARAGKLGMAHSAQQLPDLAAYLSDKQIDRLNWERIVDETRALAGDEFEIQPMANWKHIDPIREALMMRGGEDE